MELTIDISPISSLSDEDLLKLCAANKELRIERTSQGELVIMSPSYPFTGRRNSIILHRVFSWNEQSGLGEVFDSSSGFTLPNNAMRAPDAAWIAKDRWNALPEEDLYAFSHICPDFVVELMSETDRLEPAKEKMEEWIANGCHLGWLIDPKREQAHIYRADGTYSLVEGFDNNLSGENVLPQFELYLQELL